jgi:hypothetical protein
MSPATSTVPTTPSDTDHVQEKHSVATRGDVSKTGDRQKSKPFWAVPPSGYEGFAEELDFRCYKARAGGQFEVPVPEGESCRDEIGSLIGGMSALASAFAGVKRGNAETIQSALSTIGLIGTSIAASVNALQQAEGLGSGNEDASRPPEEIMSLFRSSSSGTGKRKRSVMQARAQPTSTRPTRFRRGESTED